VTFEQGKKYRLKASKRVFTIVNVKNWCDVEVKFEGDRMPITMSKSVLEPESEEVAGV
jgi:hypothetical protein